MPFTIWSCKSVAVAHGFTLFSNKHQSRKRKRASSKGEEGHDYLAPVVIPKKIFPYNERRLLDQDTDDEDDECEFDNAELPEYPRGIRRVTELKLKYGKPFGVDVISLLSNYGSRNYLVRNDGSRVSLKSLHGKYLLICCFYLPFTTSSSNAVGCYLARATGLRWSWLPR